MHNNMNKLLRTCCLTVITVATMAMVTGCSAEDDADKAAMNESYSHDGIVGEGIYEGEWTVNKKVVDTARLVVSATIQVRLPEEYLLGLCYPDYMDKSSSLTVEPYNTPSSIQLLAQGYSEQSLYHSFASTNTQAIDGKILFNTCSFNAIINGTACRVSLLSKDNNGSAVLHNATGLWTLAIPISAFLITNLETGESTTKELPITTTIYYNTKQRIG